MGGVRWKLYEEEVFWKVIVPRAPPGHDPVSKKAKKKVDPAKQWDWGTLSAQMASEMRRRFPNEALLRKYDHTLCYEHYFQNYVKRNYSPHAKPFVEAYSAGLMQTITAADQAAIANKKTKTARAPAWMPRRQKKIARRLASARSTGEPDNVAASAEDDEDEEDDEDDSKHGSSPNNLANNYISPARSAYSGPNHDEDGGLDAAAEQMNERLAYPLPQYGSSNAYAYHGNNQMLHPHPGYPYGPYNSYDPQSPQGILNHQNDAGASLANQGVPANDFSAYGSPAPWRFSDSYANHGYSYGHGYGYGYSHGFDLGRLQNDSQGHDDGGGGGVPTAPMAPMHVGYASDHAQLAYHQGAGEAANHAPPGHATGMMHHQGMSDNTPGNAYGYSPDPTPPMASTPDFDPVPHRQTSDGDGYGHGQGPAHPGSRHGHAS